MRLDELTQLQRHGLAVFASHHAATVRAHVEDFAGCLHQRGGTVAPATQRVVDVMQGRRVHDSKPVKVVGWRMEKLCLSFPHRGRYESQLSELPLHFALVDLGADVECDAQAGLRVGLLHHFDQFGAALGLGCFHIEALQVVTGVANSTGV